MLLQNAKKYLIFFGEGKTIAIFIKILYINDEVVYADDIPFENRSNYYFDVEGQSEEWITSSERVWTIQFVPRNTSYNKVVINVNVIIPNN